MGNFGIFWGNWGDLATLGGPAAQQRRRETQHLQILRNPAAVTVLAEASEETEEAQRDARSRGDPGVKGLRGRDEYDHYVMRGNEPKGILIAARTDDAESMTLLEYEVHKDHPYR